MSNIITKSNTYIVRVLDVISTIFERKHKRNTYTMLDRIRDAIRIWAMPVYDPTPEEVRAIKQGRKNYENGDYYTLEEVREELGI